MTTTPTAAPSLPRVRGVRLLATAAAALAAARVYGEPSAACTGCPVPLVELAVPVRLTRLEVDGTTAEALVTHAHSTDGGVACTIPEVASCGRPHCTLAAAPFSRWCWLCGPAR